MLLALRPSARALIVRDGRVLCMVCDGWSGRFYELPGGGVEAGESLEEAVQRECLEEAGCYVRPGRLRFAQEAVGTLTSTGQIAHHLHCIIECELEPGSEPALGPARDSEQVGVEWLPLTRLGEV